MMELSEDQLQRNKTEKEDIRITAWKFYVDKYQTNYTTRIFGNGIPAIGKSKWGDSYEKEVSVKYGGNGCYTTDVGWAGFYWHFGIFPTIGILYLLLKAALLPKKEEFRYLSYWCIFIILASIASGSILYHYQIVYIMTVLYLVYGKERNRNHLNLNKAYDNRTNNSQL